MLFRLRYHFAVRRLLSATVAVFALVLAPALSAQINGVPASVTSMGFGGHFTTTPGVPASVTSLGPNGFQGRSPFFNEPTCCINPLFPLNPNPPLSSHHRHHRAPVFPVAVPVYTVPYTPVMVVQPGEGEYVGEEEEAYRGGPTIFDRRGPGQTSRDEAQYAERARREEPEAAPQPAAQAEPEPVADQPQTVLVFKDGHEVEVQNYAVVGSMLYDLTAGHRRKIALAELDLNATAKQNDDRGIDFQIPAGSAVN
jgi:hypothetical protein